MERPIGRKVIFKGPNITVYEERGRFAIYDRRKKAVTARFSLKDIGRWVEYVSDKERLNRER